ncbi:hypothetical protein P9B03_02295 [Metasolibacillus meyeri]|uniref:Uncharacterized protein n=1 Tax=Metasolibacillus meyeri TaxID=1071052 RepID=A0AAW9NRB1_9BACL|nr:hypothetical protein [Metasolibacillus meyeri]MEC1177301.1 hypothetical protein [Metasolibacillus meyeri]
MIDGQEQMDEKILRRQLELLAERSQKIQDTLELVDVSFAMIKIIKHLKKTGQRVDSQKQSNEKILRQQLTQLAEHSKQIGDPFELASASLAMLAIVKLLF